jgi:hypothetical protein
MHAWFLVLGLLCLRPIPGPGDASAGKARPEAVTLTGRVIELTEALRALDVPADSDPIAKQVVLKTDDGTLVPLLSDETSRAFFLDERLRGRKAEIHGRRLAGLPYLQVTSFRVEDGGQLRSPEYDCDVCSISVRYPQICPCCQGPMVLRMKPEAK